MWLLGREGDSYVGLRRHCIDYINGQPACKVTDGQAWAVVVGNSDMYGSFDQFEEVLEAANYDARWYYSIRRKKWVFYGMINVDGIRIDHEWVGVAAPNGNQGTIQWRESATEATVPEFSLYPNPSRDMVQVDLRAFEGKPTAIKVMNMQGQQVLYRPATQAVESIYTGHWPAGIYVVSIESDGRVQTTRLVVSR